MAEKLVVPRLRVRKDWYKGLNDDPIDHTHPDIGVMPDAQDGGTGECLGEPLLFLFLLCLSCHGKICSHTVII